MGAWLADGLSSNAAGRVAYVVPMALAGWGVSLMLRPLIQAPAALNAGGDPACSPRCCSPSRRRPPGSGPTRPHRHGYFEQQLLHRARRGRRRGALLGRDDAVPAARGPDPRRADVRLAACCCSPGPRSPSLLGAPAGRCARAPAPGPASVARTVRAQRQRRSSRPGATPRGDEIAITRAGPTEPLRDRALGRRARHGRDASESRRRRPRVGEEEAEARGATSSPTSDAATSRRARPIGSAPARSRARHAT